MICLLIMLCDMEYIHWDLYALLKVLSGEEVPIMNTSYYCASQPFMLLL